MQYLRIERRIGNVLDVLTHWNLLSGSFRKAPQRVWRETYLSMLTKFTLLCKGAFSPIGTVTHLLKYLPALGSWKHIARAGKSRRNTMTYVVTESCIKCKYTDCVDVCPVDCFREGPNMLVIDPDECIDCTLCVAECPVEAIFAEDDVPDSQRKWTALNAELAKEWKPIIEKKPAPPDADDWSPTLHPDDPKTKDKDHLLER